ncbi:potassium channel family protein [Sphingopyxis sp. CCNWLW2]|uniref:potassium channel family protein n=1 Tax=unclassified Sphingopyxis TaxID=2614943 RepID=UPI003012B31B
MRAALGRNLDLGRHLPAARRFHRLRAALYFSTSTYVTIGYGDLVLPPGLRVLGAIEGASGIILIGWSTAFFFSIVDRMKLLERSLDTDHGGG